MSTQEKKHTHHFNESNPLSERKTLLAALLTALMMVVEILGGWLYRSMALLADGWHMSSHTLALGLSVFAYVVSRRLSSDDRFAFGTWKIEVLGGYTSALFLLVVAGLMVYQSIERFLSPAVVQYEHAIPIAAVGLLINLLCAWLLREEHSHHHSHHEHHHHDLNLRAAYLHVLADAATSVLAILALIGGKYWGITWLDPVMGVVGAILVSVWAMGLLRESSRVLLDAEMDAPVVEEIREVLRTSPIQAELQDLHVWRVSKGKYACILALSTQNPNAKPEDFKELLRIHEELAHITVEIN